MASAARASCSSSSSAAEWVGAKLAEGFTAFLANAGATMYTLGQWTGWIVASIAFDTFLTFGLGSLGKAVKVLAPLVDNLLAIGRAIDTVLAELLAPLTRLATLADEALTGLLAALHAIPLPFLDEIAEKVGLDDAPKKAPDAEDPDAPTKKPDGDENSETAEAAMVWGKLKLALGSGLLTYAAMNTAVEAIDTGDTDIVQITIDDQDAEHAWEADILLKDGDRTSTPEGWIAYGETPAERHYGVQDARAENATVADEALDELEAAWQALFEAPVEVDAAADALAAEAAVLAPKSDAALQYAADSALTLGVGDDASLAADAATVTATVEVTPNALKQERTGAMVRQAKPGKEEGHRNRNLRSSSAGSRPAREG